MNEWKKELQEDNGNHVAHIIKLTKMAL